MYLYHSVPENLHGNILYPLNTLKEKFPKIYEQEVSKYVGREDTTQLQIPTLNCLWNDVLHFLAVNPKEVKKALIDAGRDSDFTMNYYQVDSKLIEPKNATVYLYAHTDDENDMNEENFVPYNPDEVQKFSSMPQETKGYYKEIISKGDMPLLYHRIPHILYKGTLDINDLSIISV